MPQPAFSRRSRLRRVDRSTQGIEQAINPTQSSQFLSPYRAGVYIGNQHGTSRFRQVNASTGDELTQLTHTIAQWVARYLVRQGLLIRDDESSYLTVEGADTDNESPLNHLLGSSIIYRIAMGPQQGRKVITLQTLPDCSDDPLASRAGNVAGFSLHAGVAARAHERAKLERLCRYIARSAESRALPATGLFVPYRRPVSLYDQHQHVLSALQRAGGMLVVIRIDS